MNRDTLLEELHRLLDSGEPLVTMFPKQHPGWWPLELPDNVSDDMRWYADNVAWRAEDREWYQHYRQQNAIEYIARSVKTLEVGLLGGRAIGALR